MLILMERGQIVDAHHSPFETLLEIGLSCFDALVRNKRVTQGGRIPRARGITNKLCYSSYIVYAHKTMLWGSNMDPYGPLGTQDYTRNYYTIANIEP